jgi:hypothetical protein
VHFSRNGSNSELRSVRDLKAAIACAELCREIGNSAPLREFFKREVMPGNLKWPPAIGTLPVPRRWARFRSMVNSKLEVM